MNGRRYVEQHFDWSKLVAAWVAQLSLPKAPSANAPEAKPNA
jgi:hypothetical protein